MYALSRGGSFFLYYKAHPYMYAARSISLLFFFFFFQRCWQRGERPGVGYPDCTRLIWSRVILTESA